MAGIQAFQRWAGRRAGKKLRVQRELFPGPRPGRMRRPRSQRRTGAPTRPPRRTEAWPRPIRQWSRSSATPAYRLAQTDVKHSATGFPVILSDGGVRILPRRDRKSDSHDRGNPFSCKGDQTSARFLYVPPLGPVATGPPKANASEGSS
jgi:hypothetical protein